MSRSTMDVDNAEAFALRIQNEVQEDEIALRRSRNMTLSVYFFYAFFLFFFSTMLGVLLFLYRETWDQTCDVGTKVWSLVWVGRMLAQLLCNTAVTIYRLRGVSLFVEGREREERQGEATSARETAAGDSRIAGSTAARISAERTAEETAGGAERRTVPPAANVEIFQLQQRIPRWLAFLTRLVHALGFSWWMLGIDQIYCEPHCTEQTLSRTVSQVMFWITATVYIVPFLIYTLVCLCLPCIIYFMVRLAVRPADRQPTPPSLIQQLEVKTYRDLLETLRRQYTIDSQEVNIQQQRRPLPGLSLESVIGGVSTLLATSGATAAATSTSSTSDSFAADASTLTAAGAEAGAEAAGAEGAEGALYIEEDAAGRILPFRSSSSSTSRRAPGRGDASVGRSSSRRFLLEEEEEEQRGRLYFDSGSAAALSPSAAAASHLLPLPQSISVNKACPICMVDLKDEDQLLIMPCDQRHFFHKTCVEHWLETSQACPICRANIVHILTGAPAESPANLAAQRDLEMQV